MSLGMDSYVPEHRETRKNYCIRLNQAEIQKVEGIMSACDIPDFSKCIRFLIDQGYNSISLTEAQHD